MPGREDESVAYPEVFSMHWEGPNHAVAPAEVEFPAARPARASDDRAEEGRAERAHGLWHEIRLEALRRGDEALWERKLAAYEFVKLRRRGSAGDYARGTGANHATVRSWIADVGRVAYQVGYRLHEDRLLLVGEADPKLSPMRELVNRDPGGDAAWEALCGLEHEFRGEDPYFHLNEGHVLRARGFLSESDDTLKEGLALGEARRVRALLWNARGQTFWDCTPVSSWPLGDHLERAEAAFRRAAILDQTTYFPFVNLAQLALDDGDLRRAEYWIGELAGARKGMEDAMRDDLARYLEQADFEPSLRERRFFKAGPARWIAEAARRGVLALAALVLGASLLGVPAEAAPSADPELECVAKGGGRNAKGGAGGN